MNVRIVEGKPHDYLLERFDREPRHWTPGERVANAISWVVGAGMVAWTLYVVWGWLV